MTGPIDGRTYTDVMVPMGTNRDDWVAAAASYLRNNFGNSSSFVTPEDVARVRAATADRKTPWTYAELAAALPVALVPQNTWNATASHNTQAAAGGLNYAGWSTGAPQQPGMWFQIELPEPVDAHRDPVQLDAAVRRPRRRSGRSRPWRRCRSSRRPAAVPVAVPTEPAAPPPPVGTFPRGYRVEVSRRRQNMGSARGRRPGKRAQHDDRVPSGPSEVRPDHANGNRGDRARVVHSAAPALPGAPPRDGTRGALTAAGSLGALRLA